MSISTWLRGAKGGDPRSLSLGSTRRSRLNLTASASTGSPLWNLAPGLSLNSQTVGDTSRGSSRASIGWIFRSWSRSSRVSNMFRHTLAAGDSWWFMGSRVLGSTPWAMVILPEGPAEATEGSSAEATASAIRDKTRFQVMASPRRSPAFPRGRGPPTEGSSALLVERHVEGFDALVAPRLPVESLARAVQIELLVQRYRGHLLDPELVDAVIRGQPLLLVHLGLGLVDHSVEVGIGIVAEVPARPEQGRVHGLRVDGGRAPTDQPHRTRLVGVHEIVEVVHELIRLEGRLDSRLVQLARHRLRHFLVAHVTALWAIQGDLQPPGIAGLREQLLAPGQILLDGFEGGVVAKVQRGEHGRRAHGLAVEHALDDLVGVDGVGDCLPDPLVDGGPLVWPDQLVLRVVLVRHEHELEGSDTGSRREEGLGVVRDDVGQMRRDVDGHVDLAVLERGHPHRVVGDGATHDVLDLGRAPPVTWVRLEHDLLVLRPLHEAVRPGADGSLGDERAVLAGIGLGRIHGRLGEGHDGHEGRPRLARVPAHRVCG